MLEGSTSKALVSMSVPISIGMLSTFLFQVIDTYFVGQLGAEALAALSFSSTLYFLLVGLFIGFSVGVSILIGKAKGEGDTGRIQRTLGVGMVLSFLLTLVLAWVLVTNWRPIFSGLGAQTDTLPLISEYIKPLLLGMPLLTVGLLVSGGLRATGNVVLPEVVMGIAGVINLALDYGLIFGHWGLPELGIQGAAWATVASWVFVMVGMFALMIKDRLFVLKEILEVKFRTITKEIFQLAGPTIVTQMIGPLTLMYLTVLLAQQSQMAVAAFGVASRIETLLMIGILGVSTAITPFIAQNLGAKRTQRIDEAIVFGGRASTYLGILLALILYALIRPIAGWFTQDPEVVGYTSTYFYWVSPSYVAYGLYLITASIYNGLQLPTNSLKITLVKSLVFTLPFTLIGAYWGVPGIFAGLALGNLAAGIYAARAMQNTFKKVNSNLAKVNVWKSYAQDFRRLIRR